MLVYTSKLKSPDLSVVSILHNYKFCEVPTFVFNIGGINIASISEEKLDLYCEILKTNFRTGYDRVTPAKFLSNKSEQIEIINRKLTRGSYKFTKLKSIKLPTGRRVSIPTVRDRIVIEYLKDTLKNKYKVNYYNRDSLINSIIRKLQTRTPYFIVRLDIKSFFSSIPQHKLLQKIKRSSLLSFEEYELTKKILKLAGKNGIPQGLAVSNIFSEIYLENFDIEMKRIHPRINYYCRFVDDIFLLINGSMNKNEESILKSNIEIIFKKNHLCINNEKESYINFSILSQNQTPFEYLGYRFEVQNKILKLDIVQSKIRKLLDRIDLCFNDFANTKNINLLIERLKYITSRKRSEKYIFFISKNLSLISHSKKFYFGYLETYKELNSDNKIWTELDKYIKRKLLLFKRNGFIHNSLIIRQLHSFSFKRFARSKEIYKIDSLDKQQIIAIISRISPLIPTLSSETKSKLLYRYFDLVDPK